MTMFQQTVWETQFSFVFYLLPIKVNAQLMVVHKAGIVQLFSQPHVKGNVTLQYQREIAPFNRFSVRYFNVFFQRYE